LPNIATMLPLLDKKQDKKHFTRQAFRVWFRRLIFPSGNPFDL